VFLAFAPDFAVAALLISGVSTGVVAPFFADMMEGDTATVVVVVVGSSLLVPFSLPLMVHLLAGRHMSISFWAMVGLLSQVVFLPILAVGMVRKFRPGLIPKFMAVKQPFSYFVFTITNLAIFSGYSDFFRSRIPLVLVALGLSFLLAALFFILGFVFSPKKPVDDKLSSAIAMGAINNVLVIVFAARFFGPLEATLAAAYFVPSFVLILPLRVLASRKNNPGSHPTACKPGHSEM
jgi:BASS family bile acid:Na+ symporter